jgi:hypothetical protein
MHRDLPATIRDWTPFNHRLKTARMQIRNIFWGAYPVHNHSHYTNLHTDAVE